jgi:hypothetical protein
VTAGMPSPGLRGCPRCPNHPEPPMPAGGAEQVADEAAALSRALWERLAAADAPAGYQAACAGGAEAARQICTLLTRPPL